MRKLICLMLLLNCMHACKQDEKKVTPEKGEIEQLTSQLEEKVQQHKDSADLRMKLINVYDSLKMYPKAIAHLDTLLKTDSLNSDYWMMRGQISEDNKDTVRAIVSYEKALYIYPSVETQLYLANLLAEHRDAKALILCTNVARMGMGNETDANCSFIAGVYNSRVGNSKKALQLFDEAIKSNYTLMEAYMEKGFIYYDSKNYQQAIKTFQTAITVNNMYADAYYWQAKCNEALGNKDEAILNYKRAFGLDKEMKEAADAVKRLGGSLTFSTAINHDTFVTT